MARKEYIIKDTNDGNLTFWWTNTLDPSKFSNPTFFELNQNSSENHHSNNNVGIIQKIKFIGLDKNKISIHISFDRKSSASKFVDYLENALNNHLDHTLSDNVLTYEIFAHTIKENLISLFSNMHLLDKISNDLIQYVCLYFGFNYLEEVEKEINSDLVLGTKNGPMDETYFKRACILAKTANSPRLFAAIATFCSRLNLEAYAFIAANDGLELNDNSGLARSETPYEIIDTLNFRAGWAVRHFTKDDVLTVQKLCVAQKPKQAATSASASISVTVNSKDLKHSKDVVIDRKDVKEASDLVISNGPKSLEHDEDDAEPSKVIDEKAEQELYVLTHAETPKFDTTLEKDKFEFAMSWHAAKFLLRITNEKHQCYGSAQDVLSQIFSYAAGTGNVDPKTRIVIQGGDNTVDTLMIIAAKMKEMNTQLAENSKLINANGDSKSASELLEKYKKELDQLAKEKKELEEKLKSEEREHKTQNESLKTKLATATGDIEQITKMNNMLTNDKTALSNKVDEFSRQIVAKSEEEDKQKSDAESLKEQLAKLRAEFEAEKLKSKKFEDELTRERKDHNATRLVAAGNKNSAASPTVLLSSESQLAAGNAANSDSAANTPSVASTASIADQSTVTAAATPAAATATNK